MLGVGMRPTDLGTTVIGTQHDQRLVAVIFRHEIGPDHRTAAVELDGEFLGHCRARRGRAHNEAIGSLLYDDRGRFLLDLRQFGSVGIVSGFIDPPVPHVERGDGHLRDVVKITTVLRFPTIVF